MKTIFKYRYLPLFFMAFFFGIAISCSPPVAGVVIPSSSSLKADEKIDSTKEPSPDVQNTIATGATLDDGFFKVAEASGNNNEDTLSFAISGNEWCIAWGIEDADPERSLFNLVIYRDDISTGPIKMYTGSGLIAGDTLYMDEGGNVYHVKIISANVGKWTVTVGEKPDTASLSPVRITRVNYRGTKQKVYPGDLNACYKRNEPDEYVAIINESDTWQDVRGWTLVNETKGYPLYTFPEYFNACPSYYKDYHTPISTGVQPIPCILGPYQSVLVYTDEFHSETGGFNFNYAPGDIWSNDVAEVAVLYDNNGKEISRRSYIVETETSGIPSVYISYIEYKGTPYSIEDETGQHFRTVEYDEYVVIRNRTTCFQDLSRWTLKNITKGTPEFIFPEDFYICPGETLRIYTNEIHPEWSGYCLRYSPNQLLDIFAETVHYIYGDKCSFFPLGTVTPHGDCSFHYDPGNIWDNTSPDIAVLYSADGEEMSRKSYSISH